MTTSEASQAAAMQLDRQARALSVHLTDWALAKSQADGIGIIEMSWGLMYAAIRYSYLTAPMGSEVGLLTDQRTMFTMMINQMIEHFENTPVRGPLYRA